jgi:hypothetical protein
MRQTTSGKVHADLLSLICSNAKLPWLNGFGVRCPFQNVVPISSGHLNVEYDSFSTDTFENHAFWETAKVAIVCVWCLKLCRKAEAMLGFWERQVCKGMGSAGGFGTWKAVGHGW